MNDKENHQQSITKDMVVRIKQLRFEWVAVSILVRWAMVLSGLAGIWLIVSAIDYTWELPLAARRVMACGALLLCTISVLGLCWMIVRMGSLRNMIRSLEHRFELFGQRLRTVQDLHEGRTRAPIEMERVLGNQTMARWETSSPSQMVPRRSFIAWTSMAIIGATVVFGSMALSNLWGVAVQRTAGIDLPYTKMSVSPGTTEVLEGTPVDLELLLAGRTERDVTVKYRRLSDSDEKQAEWIESDLDAIKLEADSDSDRIMNVSLRKELAWSSRAKYKLPLGKAKDSVEYQFVTSSGSTETYRINVKPLIRVETVRTKVIAPAYTRSAVRDFSDSDVTALVGSEIRVELKATHALSDLSITTDDRQGTTGLIVADRTEDPKVWSFSLPCIASLRWKVEAKGKDGTPIEAYSGRLRVREDQAPSIVWRSGAESTEVHTLAEVPLEIAISDDYGVESAQIVLQFADGEERVLAEIEPLQGAETSRVLKTILPLESLKLTQRDFVGFYAIAYDNREPNRNMTGSDVRFIDIRPLRQRYREEDVEPGEPRNGNPLTPLIELMRRERLIINQTRRMVGLSPDAIAQQIKTVDRMVESQSELAALTTFLADGLVARGNDDVESLRQAEVAMVQAADSLAAGNMETALLQEQDALRYLVETRNELEILLQKNQTAMRKQTASALEGLKQKLRRKRLPSIGEIAQRLDQVAFDEEAIVEQKVLTEEEKEIRMEGQKKLVQEVADIAKAVKVTTWPTKLIPARMQEVSEFVDKANTALRTEDAYVFDMEATEVSDKSRELAAMIRAINADDPLQSLASTSKLATEAGNMERKLAEELKEGSGTGNGKPMTNRLKGQIAGRAETIADLLKLLRQPGDANASEAVQRIEEWSKESGFDEAIEQSKSLSRDKDSMSESADGVNRNVTKSGDEKGAGDESKSGKEATDGKQSEGNDAGEGNNAKAKRKAIDDAGKAAERGEKYTEAAMFLDGLFRQLASPRLDQLRAMEAKAGEIEKSLRESSTARGQNTTVAPAEIREMAIQLAKSLEENGLEELAKELRKSSFQGAAEDSAVTGGIGLVRWTGTIQKVSVELRTQIQELILQQISADRDTPVPQQYVELVNGYFKSLANPSEEDSK